MRSGNVYQKFWTQFDIKTVRTRIIPYLICDYPLLFLVPNLYRQTIHLLSTKFLNHFSPLYEIGDVAKSIFIDGHCCLQFMDDGVIGTQHFVCFR